MNYHINTVAESGVESLDVSAAQIISGLVANLRAANIRQQAVKAYCLRGKGSAATKTSRARIQREAKRRVERAKITLADAGEVVRNLKRKLDRLPWAQVV